jgi:hypothetical protein
MFKVKINKLDSELHYTVYQIEMDNDYDPCKTWFLIYYVDKWEWVDANDCEPV